MTAGDLIQVDSSGHGQYTILLCLGEIVLVLHCGISPEFESITTTVKEFHYNDFNFLVCSRSFILVTSHYSILQETLEADTCHATFIAVSNRRFMQNR